MSRAFPRVILCVLILSLLMTALCTADAAQSGVRYTNPETGYQAVILDDINLLTPSEESALVENMMPITEYGNIIFWSTDEYAYNEIDQARDKRWQMYGNDSSGILVINMDRRKVTFQSEGKINDRVNASLARSVTDNVSFHASYGDYYLCAAQGFDQIATLMEGNHIAEPMKYISYIMIALMLSFVIVVGVVFGRRFNPMTRENKESARLYTKGSLFASPPEIYETGREPRGWLVFIMRLPYLLLKMLIDVLLGGIGRGSGGGSGGGFGGGGGSGGGSGGSSSF